MADIKASKESKDEISSSASSEHATSQSVMEELFTACQSGDLASVEKILTDHPLLHINYAYANGETAVHAAASGGHLEVIKFINNKGAILNVATQKGDTAMHYACKHGYIPLIAFLTEQKLDLNRKNELGETPLHVATRQGHVQVVEYLRLYGAEVNVQNNKGCTALHIACQKRNAPIAHILLHLGCRMDLVDQMDEMPIHDACREGMLSVVQTMCAYGCPVDMENKSGMSPLHLAAKAGNTEIVRCLLLSNADMDKYNKDGVRAEDIAIAQGHTDIADMLSFLTSSITRDKRDPFIQQLLPTAKPLSRVIVKVLGSSGVGKSTLIESLKCGFLRSIFRRASQLTGYGTLPPAKPVRPTIVPNKEKEEKQNTESSFGATRNPLSDYTRGINIQNCTLTDTGDVSLWEYSSYEPYLSVYGRFIGNTNTIYLVIVSMKDSATVRRQQLHFWLSYIRSRVAPSEPIGPGGLHQWAPQVAVVATHADVGGCGKNDTGEWVMEKESAVMTELQMKYNSEMMLLPQIFVMDAQQAMGLEMRYLRVALAEMKNVITQALPPSLGILDAIIAEIPNWLKILGGFPVVSLPTFSEYIRTKVNMLATEDHIKELICQLHLIGEVIPMTSRSKEVKIVVSPCWLGSDFLGPLMSYENVEKYPASGRLTGDILKTVYPNIDQADVTLLLDLMNISAVYKVGGEFQCDFPCLNYIETPDSLWTNEGEEGGPGPISDSTVCGGLRITVSTDLTDQLQYVFPDVQQFFQRELLMRREGYKMCQWLHGFRINYENFVGVIQLVDKEKVMQLMFRGPADQREQLFYMQEYLCELLYTAVEESCPGIYLERKPLSVHDLKQGSDYPAAYSTTDIFNTSVEGNNKLVQLTSNTEEKLVDLLAYGSPLVYSGMVFGPDLHISYLSLYTRCKLAYILDEPNKPGHDWEALATALALSAETIAKMNVGDESKKISKTDRVLSIWSRNRTATNRVLRQKLIDIGREEAGEVLVKHAPLFYYTPPEGAGLPNNLLSPFIVAPQSPTTKPATP